jgi:HEAT repeat protein
MRLLVIALFLPLFLPCACGRVEKDRPLDEVIAAARAGEDAAVRDLIRRFPHPDPEVSLKAWEAVIGLGQAAEPALIEALGAGERDVAEAAAGALGSVGTAAAVEPLITALRTWPSRRYVAAWALGERGDTRAVPALVAALGDGDPEVCKYAARSLVKLGREATPALLEALGSPSERVRHYAVRALGEIRDERSVEPLLAAGEKVDREVHLWALGRLGDRRAFDVIAAGVADRDVKVRLTAIQALRDLGDERALPLLTAALEDPEWMIREWAARGLESITGSRHRYRNQKGEQAYPYDLYR